MKLSGWLLPLALGAGVFVGLAFGRGQRSAPAAAPPRVPLVAAVDMTALRRAIAEECRPAATSSPAAAPTPAAPPTATATATATAEPTADQDAADAEARDLVERAVAAGHWSANEATALRRLLAHVTRDQRDEVLHTLLPEINSGRVRVDTGLVPPF
jgi:hypothetical protein